MLVTASVYAHSNMPIAAHIRRPDLYESLEYGQGHLGAISEPEPEFIQNARNPYQAGMKPKLKKF